MMILLDVTNCTVRSFTLKTVRGTQVKKAKYLHFKYNGMVGAGTMQSTVGLCVVCCGFDSIKRKIFL